MIVSQNYTIDLGQKLIDINDEQFCSEVKACLRRGDRSYAVIDEAGLVYPMQLEAHQEAFYEITKMHNNPKESVIGFGVFSRRPCFYSANKNDGSYPAIKITEQQMMAMYNMSFVYGFDIVKSLAEDSNNMGFSADDDQIQYIVGNVPNIKELKREMEQAKKHNVYIFQSVTGISSNELSKYKREMY